MQITNAVWAPNWIWAYQEFHTCLYSRLPLWLCEGASIALPLYWLVGVCGWLLGDWVRRQETVNGFLNSAEQPFAKACGTSVLLSRGLQWAAHSDQWREATDTQRTPTNAQNTHTCTLSPDALFSLRSVDGFQCDATALPIHCYRQEMLTRITSLAARVVGLAQDCPASSHSHIFFFFFKHLQLWKQRWWSIRSLWIVARLNWLNYISYYQIIRFLLFFYWYATHLKKHILKCAALLWCYMLSAK